MDPDKTLADMIRLAAVIQDQTTPEELESAAADLARSVQDLNAWIQKGGHLPRLWQRVWPVVIEKR